MISTRWLEKRKPYWSKLETLLNQSAKSGLKSLTRTDLQELSLLYRQTAADLAAIREDRGSVHFARYVNQLLVRAHNTIYSGRRASASAMFSFFRKTFPVTFRRNLKHFLLAVIIFLIAGGVGAMLTRQNPDFKVKLLGPEMVETIDRHEMWTHSIVGIKPLASSAIMTNNLTVSFVTFASGIAFGVGTFFYLYVNGMMLGVIGAACHQYGMSLALWSFVAPHGSLELPAILIAGGAGFRLGYSMLFPGALRWKDSVAQGGIEATRLVSGVIPMLVIAGTLEGFFSPSRAPVALKFSVGGLLFVLLLSWLFRPVKPAREAQLQD